MNTLASLTLKEVIVGAIGALIVAGLGFILGATKNRLRSQDRKRRANQALSAFGGRMLDAGVTNFYSGRDDWARYRQPADLGAYLRTAKYSVDIACYWLAQGVLSGIPKVLADLAERGLEVRVVTIDPGGPAVNCLTQDLETSASDIRKNVRQTIATLQEVQANLSVDAKTRFHVSLTRVVPQAAVILLDRSRETSVLQLEFRPYRTVRAHSFSLELRRRESAELHGALEAAWSRFFDDSVDL